MAGNQRTLPDMMGKVFHISADLARVPQQQEFTTAPPSYQVRISLPEEEVRRLGDLRLQPGMPTEAFIQTNVRTPLQYLLKPLREQIARTFRER